MPKARGRLTLPQDADAVGASQKGKTADGGYGSKCDLPSLESMSVSLPKADIDSSSGSSTNPWLSTTLPSCVIGT